MNCILHVGAGKCGSSSLQAALSSRPRFGAGDGSAYEYLCIGPPQSGLSRETAITHAALRSPLGYVNSAKAETWAEDEVYFARLADVFPQLADDNITPVLSCEAWLGEAGYFTEHNILPRLGLNAKIILFVRPQVSWINSAWWQWGAWSGRAFDHWLETIAKGGANWANHIRRWHEVPGVESVEVYSATRDVVATFFGALGAPEPEAETSNASLDGQILRFLQRNRDFRPHEHASAIDFILQRSRQSNSGGAPWVIPHAKIAELLDCYREQNKDLLSFVSESERQIIENDPCWWDADAYQDREVVSPDPPMPTVEDVEALTRRAIHSVVRLDERVRSLRAHVAKDQQLAIAQEQIEHLEHLLAAEKDKWLPQHLRKAVSINGVRRLMGL